ncbi:hypothetical protein E1258_12805 [Micromonospora sp. KC207]|uniref:hypothetical protein n=1 Tax=Micromonospora sp. KC207 TaxID=2530377 RepID=UPI001051C0D0|nr:hypothetical protein [Micromonospora sp. KC207]TDC61022.1 hypothetical protein E1258_12805 [Micromonospora sp. KC207]
MSIIATSAGVRDPHVVVPFADGTPEVARLSFDSGLAQLGLRVDEQLTGLMAADFAHPLPLVWAAGHNVHVEYPLGSRLLRHMGPNTVRLSPAVPWAFDVHGGAEHLDADLTGLDVRSVAFHSGATHLRLILGHPTVSTTLRLTSVRDLRVDRPADVPVRLEIGKGATKVLLDDRWFGAVGGGLIEQSSRPHTGDRWYQVIVSGSADTVTIGAVA